MKQLINPIKLIWFCVILSTTFYSRSQSFEQGKLYVTVNSEDYILKKDNSGNLASEIPILDSLIMNFNISDFSLAFPLSPTLTDAYEVTCDCKTNID